VDVLRFVYSLQPGTKVEYPKLRFLILKVLLDIDIAPSQYYEWTTSEMETRINTLD